MSTLFPEGHIPHIKVRTMEHDKDSEQAQALKDRAEKIFNASLHPLNIEPQVIMEAVHWGFRNGKLDEICNNISGDDAYTGACLYSLLREYLWVMAMKEAENE